MLLWPDSGCMIVQRGDKLSATSLEETQQNVNLNQVDVILAHHSRGQLATDRWIEMVDWEANLWRSLIEISRFIRSTVAATQLP